MSQNTIDRAVQRRCAAYAALESVLPQSELLESLWMLHENYHSEEMSGIMAFINAVAQRFSLSADIRKRLYQDYFGFLRASPAKLPGDPWPMMQAYRNQDATPQRVARSALAPPQPQPQTAKAAPPAEPLAAELCVFGALLANACAMMQQFHSAQAEELSETFFVLLQDEKAPQSLQDELQTWWPGGGQKTWRMDLPVKQLAQIVHLYYLALCQAIGPVAADRLLTRAAAKTAELPEAGVFSPQRLF
ncbi:MAG: hypothetical protein ACU837_08395 [Gammaproteobacteria bacterium]